MSRFLFSTAGYSPALCYAVQALQEAGCSFTERPSADVTHLLLPVPSLEAGGHIKGGVQAEEILCKLNKEVILIGGNLQSPVFSDFAVIDLLQDIPYLCQNAAITAQCAVALALERLPITLTECTCLVIGWGRIGKCLSKLLQDMGAQVTVAARKLSDRAMAQALGFKGVDTARMQPQNYQVIFNTAPELLLPDCPGEGLKIDLASKQGITGKDVLWARGLPGKMAPEDSGALIAQRVLYYIKEEKQ